MLSAWRRGWFLPHFSICVRTNSSTRTLMSNLKGFIYLLCQPWEINFNIRISFKFFKEILDILSWRRFQRRPFPACPFHCIFLGQPTATLMSLAFLGKTGFLIISWIIKVINTKVAQLLERSRPPMELKSLKSELGGRSPLFLLGWLWSERLVWSMAHPWIAPHRRPLHMTSSTSYSSGRASETSASQLAKEGKWWKLAICHPNPLYLLMWGSVEYTVLSV